MTIMLKNQVNFILYVTMQKAFPDSEERGGLDIGESFGS